MVGCALAYGAIFLLLGVELPYLPVWLDGRGFSSFEIGLIVGAPLWARIALGPMIGYAADLSAAHRLFVIGLALVAATAAAALSAVHALVPAIVLVAIVLVASHSGLPLVDMLAIDTSRRDGRDYGRMRLWGSIAFIVANLGAGVAIARAGSEVVIWLIAGAALALAVAATMLPHVVRSGAHAPRAARPGLDGGAVRALLADRRFVLLVIAAGLVQASHAVYYGFGTLTWQRAGWTSTSIGLLWATGVAVEILLFSMSGRVIAAVGARRLLVIGALGGIVRWTAMAAEPAVTLTFLLQAMHALSFGATYLATVHLIHALAPPERGATAQALNSAMGSGLAMALALMAAGALHRQVGAGAYLLMAAMAAVGLVAALALARTQDTTDQPS